MTLFHLHKDFCCDGRRKPRSHWPRCGLAANFRVILQSIVAARMRRLQCELMFHDDSGNERFAELIMSKIPQRPMILGDKWDF